jgi:hypothetical protein
MQTAVGLERSGASQETNARADSATWIAIHITRTSVTTDAARTSRPSESQE